MEKQNKKWYESNTKRAALLAGLGMILSGLVSWNNGASFPIGEFWTAAVTILGIFGLRDLPFINK